MCIIFTIQETKNMQYLVFQDKVTILEEGLNKIILTFYYKIYSNLFYNIINLNEINQKSSSKFLISLNLICLAK